MRSPYLLSFLIDLYQEKCLRVPPNEEDDVSVLEQEVIDLCNSMVTTHDTIRAKYWQFMLNKFKLNLERRQQNASHSDRNTTSASTDDSAV